MQCTIKCGFSNFIKADCNLCGGKATTHRLDYQKCAHHHQVVIIMDSKGLQLTTKCSLVQNLTRH